MGVHGHVLEMIKELYRDMCNCVHLNNHYSSEFLSTQGAHQGDNWSPNLFNVYINSLLETLKATKLGIKMGEQEILNSLAYADDLVIFAETEEKMQLLLDATSEWCHKWRAKININKTKLVHFRRTLCKNSNKHFRICNQTAEYCNNYKYLSVMLNCHMNM